MSAEIAKIGSKTCIHVDAFESLYSKVEVFFSLVRDSKWELTTEKNCAKNARKKQEESLFQVQKAPVYLNFMFL
jgi:hypothetical protein